jgi:hypothetical protein
VSFQRLKVASFTHSVVYLALLAVWLAPGLHGAEFVLGLTHGLGWIAMSLACVAAVRLRVIPLRLAVAVAVLGGVGPFFGSAEFVRIERGRKRAPGTGRTG